MYTRTRTRRNFGEISKNLALAKTSKELNAFTSAENNYKNKKIFKINVNFVNCVALKYCQANQQEPP